MSLFSKLSNKNNSNNEKTLYPWSQKKLGGSSNVLPRTGHTATAVSSEGIVVYGGIHRSSTKKELFYIDINNLSATSIHASGDIPSPRILSTMVFMSGYLMLYGGKPIVPDEKYDSGFYILNLHSKHWTRIQMEGNQPIERSGHTAIIHEGVVYIWGGQQEGTYFNDLVLFNTSTFNSTPRWEFVGYNNECPEPRSGHISQIYENKLYIFGGTNGRKLLNDLWSFDLHTGLWTRIDADGLTPIACELAASAMADDVIYIIGGKGENGADLNDLFAFKVKSRRWYRFQNMGPAPSPRHGLTMTTVKDRLFIVGGDNGTHKMEDSSFIYILDSTKIKYPIENNIPVDHHNSPIEDHRSSPQQQYVRMQQQQQQQQQPRPLVTTMNESESPTQTTPTNSSPSSTSSPRHRSFYPNNEIQNSTQPPVRPPRHISTVPEAALRRPRATSPLPHQPIESPEMTADMRRPYHPNNESDASPLTPSPLQASILANTDERWAMAQQQQQMVSQHQIVPQQHQQQNIPQQQQQQQQQRASPNSNHPPPRPPRDGVGLLNSNNSNIMINTLDHDEAIRNKPQPTRPQQDMASSPVSPQLDSNNSIRSLKTPPKPSSFDTTDNERQRFLQEIQSRDTTIAALKSKESWWRAEVAMARKQNPTQFESAEADENLLMDMDHLPRDKVKLFEQLVSVKTELRRVRAQVEQECVSDTDRMRVAALQEAAYFRAKYLALKSRRKDEGLEMDRCDELERRLVLALKENDVQKRLVQQLETRSEHDRVARKATEERAQECQARAEEAQEAQQRTLEELELTYQKVKKAETQVRENAIKMADLSRQLSEALQQQQVSTSYQQEDLKVAQLEAANLKARNELAVIKERLAEQMDEIEKLRQTVQERDAALVESQRHIEDYEIQLRMMREVYQQQKMKENGISNDTITDY